MFCSLFLLPPFWIQTNRSAHLIFIPVASLRSPPGTRFMNCNSPFHILSPSLYFSRFLYSDTSVLSSVPQSLTSLDLQPPINLRYVLRTSMWRNIFMPTTSLCFCLPGFPSGGIYLIENGAKRNWRTVSPRGMNMTGNCALFNAVHNISIEISSRLY